MLPSTTSRGNPSWFAVIAAYLKLGFVVFA